MMQTGGAVDSPPLPHDAAPEQAGAQPIPAKVDGQFWWGVVSAVALGAVVRFTYLFHGAPRGVFGDGLDYHLSARRLADGLGYTSSFGDTGAENAQHPPGWQTVLAAVTEAGGHSLWAHQVTGVVIGLGVVLLAGLIGRRFAGRRVGITAALLAAVYPGFWVLEPQVLSEPLGLLVGGVLLLALADLWQRPTLARAVLAGALTGALALVRAEQLALLVLAVAPLLLLNPRLELRRRCAWAGAAVLAAAVPIAPWAIHNLGRFEEPVILSTSSGNLLLMGNCPPATYSGDLMGFLDNRCGFRIGASHPGLDRSQMDTVTRRAALDNVRDNLDRLPVTALARHGRMLGVFHTEQMAEFAANWFGSTTWPVWTWLSSFWVVAPLAVYGSILLRRSRTFQWPLLAPVLLVVLIVTVSYGEPRYHTPADLGIVVLAAVAVDRFMRRARRGNPGDGGHPRQRSSGTGGHTEPGPSGMLRTTTSTGPA
jgi:4-amino-4-deoxy-L-arabinose transferase-like glycosyltransferase